MFSELVEMFHAVAVIGARSIHSLTQRIAIIKNEEINGF